ncbi:PadR family transcriptional regulator [Clostridium cibarium]|uniref:Helix-turn-helix transcriptional regulator n=1 Tax=Clostridium cibarium TaxID=2762247 RepID=A0ABR8PTY8_9CLOT|nr:PadR family transcriptional regulator [Clostridium cibarium]MBD7911640.1 helix-turn-helix transcriptional regulator [Clostridium cibarium]
MAINKELLKGSTVILILSLLDQRPMYGYEMIKEMEVKSEGVFTLKEGTLYPILHSLEAEGMVECYWTKTDGGRKRKYYKITKNGREYAKEKQKEWKIFRSAVDKVIWEGAVLGW